MPSIGKESKDITLINVSFPTDFMGKKSVFVPAGILYLCAYLEMDRFTPEILDYQLCDLSDKYSPETLAKFIGEAGSKVIGMGILAKDLPMVLVASRLLKKEDPERIIILGGPGPTGSGKGLMEEFPFIDFLVRGEGEITLLELMHSIKNGGGFDRVKSLVWRDGKKVVANHRRGRITALDEMPVPAFHLVDSDKYDTYFITGSRGCANFCTFCDQAALWQGCEIKRSVGNLMKEIDYLKDELKYDWNISFSDNEFCKDPERFDAFLEELGARKYFLPFSMDRRIDSVDDEILKKARRGGCMTILYGVESGSKAVLDEIKKNLEPETIYTGLLASSKHIKFSVASFMFNFPFENLMDFLDTINIIYPLSNMQTENTIFFQLHYLAPLPRTPVLVKYRDKLIRRNVSNMMTSKDNESTYDLMTNNHTKNILVLPKHEDSDTGEPEEINKIIEKYPNLFPSHYIYSSPDLELKERIIDILKIVFPRRYSNILFEWKDLMIFFGKDFITVAGDREKPEIPAVFEIIGMDQLKNPEEKARQLKKYPKKHYLLSIDLTGIPVERTSGRLIVNALDCFRRESIRFTLLTHIPDKFLSFTPRLKLKMDYKMPVDPLDSADLFYVDTEGMVKTFDGRTEAGFNSYDSKNSIYQSLFPKKDRQNQ